ncbi:unnamed protein product, partial [Porites lobata]
NLKLVSLNVRGISNFTKRRTIYTWCRKQKADFVFLQETHSKKETEVQWKNEWGGEILFSHGSPNSCDKDLIQFFRKLHGLLQMEDLDSEENIILGVISIVR